MFRVARIWLAALGLTVVLLAVTASTAWAENGDFEWGDSGEGVSCVFDYGNEDGGAPPSCEGTVLVYERVVNLGNNLCVWMPARFYDCETGTTQAVPTEYTDPNVYAVEGACTKEEPGASPPCGGLIWQDGLTWVTEYGDSTCSAWKWELYVSASLPCNRLAIYPYPATTVGWPSGFKFLGGAPVTARAGRAYAGAGTPGNPRVGDQRNIVLQIRLVPARNALELYIPRWGRVVDGGKSCPEQGALLLPAQNNISRPRVWACWDLPSHPAAGGVDQAGRYFPDDPVGADAPLFKGWGRVPYYAYWSLSYEELKERTWCDTSYANWEWDENEQTWVPECTAGGKAGHWESETYWDTVARGGLIDPDWVAGLPAALKADLDGDGDADAFWSYGVQVVRMDENGRLTGWWQKEYICRTEVPIVVREAQSRIAWPEGGPRVGP